MHVLTKAPHSSPMRARYGCLLWVQNVYPCSMLIITLLCAISLCSEPRYRRNWQYTFSLILINRTTKTTQWYTRFRKQIYKPYIQIYLLFPAVWFIGHHCQFDNKWPFLLDEAAQHCHMTNKRQKLRRHIPVFVNRYISYIFRIWK